MPVTEPEVLTVVARGRQGPSEVWANVFHVRKATATDLTLVEAQTVIQPFNVFYDALDGILADTWFLDEIMVRQETSGIEFTESVPLQGASANPMPFETAIVVSWSTAASSRRGRGRTYLAGWHEGQNDGGIIASATQTAVADAAEDLGNGLATDAVPLVVWSEVGGIDNEVNRLRVGRLWDTQRRRENRLSEAYVSRTLA